MGHPWGISGPGFIWLYILGLVVLGLLTLGLRRRLRTVGRASAASGQPLTTDELAVLAGGRPRMIESVVAGLIERGVIRVERRGKLHPTTGVEYQPQSDLEAKVLGEVRKRPGRELYLLQRRITTDRSVDEVRSRLAARGLYFPGGAYGNVVLAAAPLIVLTVIGIVRLVVGIQGNYPVGFLVALLMVSVLLIGFALRRFQPGPTGEGVRVLTGRSAITFPTGSAAARVAYGGMSSYPDASVASVFRFSPATPNRRVTQPRPRRARAYHGGGGYYVYGGSSCSGYSSSSCGSTSSSCSSSSCSSTSSCSSGSSGSSCGGGGGCGGGSS